MEDLTGLPFHLVEDDGVAGGDEFRLGPEGEGADLTLLRVDQQLRQVGDGVAELLGLAVLELAHDGVGLHAANLAGGMRHDA